jgi:predicted DNA binding CopG/RHH family protein
MSNVHAPISTEIKLRLPTEMLEGIELWAAAHSIPRSRAIRLLVYQGLAHVGIPQTKAAHPGISVP